MPKKQTFIDQVKIFVQAGNGGNGHVGFFRAKFIPKGGPNGGDGGDGGNVVFVGSRHKSTLYDYLFKKHFRAQNGEKGGRNQCTGANGASVEIPVPFGTLIFDEKSNEFLGEILEEGQTWMVEKGGRGGLGNLHFVSSVNQAPQKSTPGEIKEGRWVRLELRLLADLGLVGLPNAGKSSLLSALTHAKPKIADYPFTTLVPCLGIFSHSNRSWKIADLPGLIEKAHQGVGLGFQFLRHIQRTRLLLYVVAASPEKLDQAWLDFSTVQHEIFQYDSSFKKRPFLIALNKMDLVSPSQQKSIEKFFSRNKKNLLWISAKEKKGLQPLVEKLDAMLSQ